VAEAEAGLDVQAAFVGAAVQLGIVHALQHGTAHLAHATLPAGVEEAGDAAHGVLFRIDLTVRSTRPEGHRSGHACTPACGCALAIACYCSAPDCRLAKRNKSATV
jgi:hypothetical protein